MALGGLSAVMRPFNLVVTILLARLLDPSDFGAVALAMVVLGTTHLFSGLGMGSAIIHSRLERGKIAFQSFVVTVCASLLLFGLVVANLQPLANLLGDPQLTPVLRWLSWLILLNTLTIVPTALLKKDLLFGRVAQIGLIGQVVYTAVVLPLAFLGYGLWSLVAAQLSSSLANVVLTWWLCPGWDWIRPRPWDKTVLRSLMGYGLQTTGGGVLGYLISHFDDWLVGTALGAAALGFYRRAYDFMDRLVIELSGNVIGGVLFSSFAQIQEDMPRLRRAYAKSLRLLFLVMAPIGMGVLATAPLLVPVLFGAKWNPMIAALQLYAVMVLTRSLATITSSLFSAVGRPDVAPRGGVIMLACMVPCGYLLLGWGIEGVAVAVLLADLAGIAYFVYMGNRILPGSARDTLAAAWPALLAAGSMALIVQLAKAPLLGLVGASYTAVVLAAQVALGVAVYGVVAWFLEKALVLEILRLGLAALDRKGKLGWLAGRLGRDAL